MEVFWYLVVMWCLYGVSRLLFSMAEDAGAVDEEDTLFRGAIMRVWRVALLILTLALVLLKWV